MFLLAKRKLFFTSNLSFADVKRNHKKQTIKNIEK